MNEFCLLNSLLETTIRILFSVNLHEFSVSIVFLDIYVDSYDKNHSRYDVISFFC